MDVKTLKRCIAGLALVGTVVSTSLAWPTGAQAAAADVSGHSVQAIDGRSDRVVPPGRRARPEISRVMTTGAPIGGRGGIFGPYVQCGSYDAPVSAMSTVTNYQTGAVREFRWEFAAPNPWLLRGQPGYYRVATTIECRHGVSRTFAQRARIRQKTHATTMSWQEFNRIRRGMTFRKVTRILGGYEGRSGGRYNGQVSRTYESMPFWSLSDVTFRRGRVVSKAYNFGHD